MICVKSKTENALLWNWLSTTVGLQKSRSPLALAGVQNQVLVVLGADCELVLRWVKYVEQEMTLSGAEERRTSGET